MRKYKLKSWLLLFFACSSGLVVFLCARIGEVSPFTSGDSPVDNPSRKSATEVVSDSIEEVRQTARAITVKIISKGETIGSGVLFSRQGSTYTVLTNDHVLRSADSPYQIQTCDDRLFDATVKLRQAALNNNDLAILEIKNVAIDYRVADFDSDVQPEEEVFAAGFPLNYNSRNSDPKNTFTFHQGKIFLQLPKALEGGYQLGYTNEIQKGMSGGPLLNRDGAVVAINGMHAEPLWGDPYIYKDGSRPDSKLNLSQYSWGIPIKSVINQ
jgi:serine protease DegQ